jgi:hypothetical protein
MAGNEFTEASDVYSFGVILWELVSRQIFFSDTSFNAEIEARVMAGKRPAIPPQCYPLYAQLIRDCWDPEPSKRPSFKDVINRLQDFFNADLLTDSNPDKKITLRVSNENLLRQLEEAKEEKRRVKERRSSLQFITASKHAADLLEKGRSTSMSSLGRSSDESSISTFSSQEYPLRSSESTPTPMNVSDKLKLSESSTTSTTSPRSSLELKTTDSGIVPKAAIDSGTTTMFDMFVNYGKMLKK